MELKTILIKMGLNNRGGVWCMVLHVRFAEGTGDGLTSSHHR